MTHIKKNGTKRLDGPKLARPGDPYVTIDGNIVPPIGSNTPTQSEKPDAKKYKPLQRRSLKDFTVTPQFMNGVCCVFVYTLMGVSDREIMNSLAISHPELKGIRKHEAYTNLFEIVSKEFIHVNSDMITTRLAAMSGEMVDNIYHIAKNGTKENNVLKASIDLLDRAGFAPREQANKGSLGEDDLRISIYEGGKELHMQVGRMNNKVDR